MLNHFRIVAEMRVVSDEHRIFSNSTSTLVYCQLWKRTCPRWPHPSCCLAHFLEKSSHSKLFVSKFYIGISKNRVTNLFNSPGVFLLFLFCCNCLDLRIFTRLVWSWLQTDCSVQLVKQLTTCATWPRVKWRFVEYCIGFISTWCIWLHS